MRTKLLLAKVAALLLALEGPHSTFGRSGQIRSQRSIMLCASRLGQSPLSCSLHFIMLALRPYFSMSLWTL
jgi:hypothetical protein